MAACEASAKRNGWHDVEKAIAQGYAPAWNDPVHYVNRDYVFDDAFLDCDKPEYLMYYDSPGGKVLTGVMFITRTLLEEGPQVGGPLTLWHYHYWVKARCLDEGILALGLAKLGECDLSGATLVGAQLRSAMLQEAQLLPVGTARDSAPRFLTLWPWPRLSIGPSGRW